MKFCEKIKELRKQHNLTQEQLAEKLFVTRNAISKWENDKGYPNMDSLKLISKTFFITIDNLMNEEDVKRITLENSDKLARNNDLLLSLIVFIIYTMIGTLVPGWLFHQDPTSGIGYFLILAPLSYSIIGILAGFISNNKVYTIIAGLLAIIPTYFFFDMFTNVGLWFWQFIYYALFVLAYLLIRYIKIKAQQVKQLKKLIYIVSYLTSFTFLVYIILSVIGIIHNYSVYGSAPWYTTLLLTTIIFSLPLVIEIAFLIYFINQYKENKCMDR